MNTRPFLKPVAFMDVPVFDCVGAQPIPISTDLPFEVVASLAKTCQVIDYIDATAQYIGVYTGIAGHEVLVAIIGGGMSKPIDCLIGQGTRVSVRSMGAAIAVGSFCIHFMGLTS
jgi:hypothetical protein